MSPHFNNMNELTSYLDAMENRVKILEGQNDYLRRSISQLGQDAPKVLPETGLLSHSFFKRAFTVWGHYFIVQLLISLVIGIILGSLVLIPGLLPWLNSLVNGFFIR
jgi:hypothetical protein